MVSAGIPELRSSADIDYLRDRLMTEKTNKAAEAVFEKEIKSSLKSVTRLLDNVIHNFMHK